MEAPMLTVANGRLVRWPLLLGLPILFTLTACGETTKDYQEYHRIISSGAFPSRDKPADQTTLTDDELSQRGYVNIGAIDISSVDKPDINAIRREAARKGADLIKTESSSQPGHQLTKTCQDLLSQSNDMTGGGGNNFAECEKYSIEETTVNLSVIKGSLWRHDPQMK
jgi:hypothetical protein